MTKDIRGFRKYHKFYISDDFVQDFKRFSKKYKNAFQ